MRYIIFLILIGCANPQPFDVSEIDGKTYTFKLHLVDKIPGGYKGLHVYDKDINLHGIWLIRDKFPQCLEHEILHVLQPNWHEGRYTDEYCYSR